MEDNNILEKASEFKPLVADTEQLSAPTILQTLEHMKQYIIENAKPGDPGTPGAPGTNGTDGVSVTDFMTESHNTSAQQTITEILALLSNGEQKEFQVYAENGADGINGSSIYIYNRLLALNIETNTPVTSFGTTANAILPTGYAINDRVIAIASEAGYTYLCIYKITNVRTDGLEPAVSLSLEVSSSNLAGRSITSFDTISHVTQGEETITTVRVSYTTGEPSDFEIHAQNGAKGEPGEGGTITVDEALSFTSTNPVQNKIISTAVNDLATELQQKRFQHKISASGVGYNMIVISSVATPITSGDIFTEVMSNLTAPPVRYDIENDRYFTALEFYIKGSGASTRLYTIELNHMASSSDPISIRGGFIMFTMIEDDTVTPI